MNTSAECYEIAWECEKQASEVKSDRARAVLQRVAAQWRRIGDELKAAHGTVAPHVTSPSLEGESDGSKEGGEAEDRETQGRQTEHSDTGAQ